ncbi:MAG TPA: 2OG-Fe(II) oxygenase family protein [Candidatus Paceibacterota bacterium]
MINIADIENRGMVYVPYPSALRRAVLDAIAAWEAFCNLPEEVKLRFPYEPDKKQSGNGYELKKERGETLDRKEDFHLRLSAHDELLTNARALGDERAEQFVEAALLLPDLIEPLLVSFAQEVEERYKVQGFSTAVADAKPEFLLRFLHYFGDCEPEEMIGSPHVDKGGFTLHLYESDKGVEHLSTDKQSWIPMPLAHEDTVIFPALGLQQYLGSRVKALCHRIVATPECARQGRFSAVCFVDFRGARHYDKARHGRLQKFPPGFNYDMPAEQFNDLFVE